MKLKSETIDKFATLIVVVAIVLVVVGVVTGAMIGIPKYNVWQQGKRGEARLREAESSRRILVVQAQAEVEAAKLRAEAIEAVGKMAKTYPEFREQEFIAAFAEALQNPRGNRTIIYVPTEGNIPIVEAGRSVDETSP